MQEVYEQQKELILLGERVVLSTLAFDLNVLHPYKPLVEAIKKFKVAQNALAQVAWNFVNDGYAQLFSCMLCIHGLFPWYLLDWGMCADCGPHSACSLSPITLLRGLFFLLRSS